MQPGALFSSSPLALTAVGDSITLTVVFTDTSGLLTQSGLLGFGLYNSGQNLPVASGLNGTAVNNLATANTGSAQLWSGYVGQVAFTCANSRIMNRFVQGVEGNNAQDVTGSGSTSATGSSFASPAGATVGAQNVNGVTLTAGQQYTEVLTIGLDGSGNQVVTNWVYAGNGTGGSLLTQFGGITTGSTLTTNSFDALAIGWRATANTTATTIDINNIQVDYSPVPEPATFALAGLGILGLVIGRRSRS